MFNSEEKLGLDVSTSSFEKMFNRMLFTLTFFATLYIPIFYKIGAPRLSVLFVFFTGLISPSIYYFNKRRPGPLYKLILVFSCSLWIYVPVTHIGSSGGGDFYYFCVLILASILFRKREVMYLYASYISVFIAWFLSNVIAFKLYYLKLDTSFIDLAALNVINFVGASFLSFFLLSILMKSRDELDQKQRKLVEKEKLSGIGELAAGIGHEINNPLAIADGNIKRIKRYLNEKNSLDKEVISSFDKYEASSSRIRKIVDGLRIFSRMNQDEIKTENVIETINTDIFLVKEIYSKEGIQVEHEFESKEIYANINQGKFNQVIMNLLSNAKDALLETNNKDKKITLSISEVKGNVEVIVKDNGPGIKKDNLSRIFESFYTTKEVGKGTGMGLSISFEVIQSFGGEITVDSVFGKGTSIKITLPVVLRGKNDVISINEVEKKGEVIDQKRKVLIVDDEEDIRFIIREYLEDLGCSCEEAEDGEVALGMLKRNTYDYVFSDITMPNMNGVDFIKQAQKFKHYAVFVIITGGICNDFENDPQFMGLVKQIIYKPFAYENLRDVFKRTA